VKLAIVCSAHGFGHVTRQLALAEALRSEHGVDPVLYTAAPPAILAQYLPNPRVVRWVADVGLVQPDSLTEDVVATRAALERVCSSERIDALARELKGFDRVVVDMAPTAMEAARRAGVPVVAVGNFDWAWIYRGYPELHDWADRFAAWQAPVHGLELSPGPGLHGFASVTPIGLVGRQRPAHRLGPGRVLVSFGGFGLDTVDALLPHLPGVRWVLAPPMPALDRPDVEFVPDVSYPALVAGVDAVLSKPGYGIFAEAALAGTPLIWVPRGRFPEAPSLVAAARARGDVLCEATAGSVAQAVAQVLGRSRPAPCVSQGKLLARAVLG
jgi:hypothetical protein